MKKRNLLPESREQAEVLMNALAGVENNRRLQIARRDEAVLAITEQFAAPIDALETEAKGLRALLEDWAMANPHEYKRGTKTIELPSGTISQRTTTPSLKLLRGWTWERVLGAVMSTIPNFVRSKPEVDKEAILAQRDELEAMGILPKIGVKVDQREKWNIEPLLTDTEAVQRN